MTGFIRQTILTAAGDQFNHYGLVVVRKGIPRKNYSFSDFNPICIPGISFISLRKSNCFYVLGIDPEGNTSFIAGKAEFGFSIWIYCNLNCRTFMLQWTAAFQTAGQTSVISADTKDCRLIILKFSSGNVYPYYATNAGLPLIKIIAAISSGWKTTFQF
ncbi:hypothetical protein D3C71_1523120 [compost metagenome]